MLSFAIPHASNAPWQALSETSAVALAQLLAATRFSLGESDFTTFGVAAGWVLAMLALFVHIVVVKHRQRSVLPGIVKVRTLGSHPQR